MKRLVLGLLVLASSAHAFPPDWHVAGRYDEMRGEPIVKTYLLGAGKAYVVANAALEVAGRPKLYCQPPDLVLTAADYVEIFEKSLEKFRARPEARPLLATTEDEIVLYYGLLDAFPCRRE